MQGPGGWLQLGFILNCKCLVPVVKAKPCTGHWDSCAQEEGRVSQRGIWTCSLGNRELLAARMLRAWAGQEQGAGTGCALHPAANPRASSGSWTLSQRPSKSTPSLGKSLSQLSSPVPAFSAPRFVAIESWCLWDRNRNARESMNIRIVWGA